MIGTVSTGRCPMPPARDRSGTLNYFFFENFEISDRPKSDHIVFVFRNIFCREMESDIKGPTCFDHNQPCFFPGTRGMTWALATALLTKLRR